MKSLSYVFPAGTIFILALAVCIYTGCSNNVNEETKPIGHLDLSLGISVQTYDVFSDLKAAEPEEFVVEIYNEAGTQVLSFSRAGDLPESIALPEGSYYVVAYSDNNLPAAFENDYYYGESELFTISAGNTTSVSLTCRLANIMVTVVYSPAVVSGFDSYQTTVSNTEGSLVFAETETRPGFFDQGPLSIEAELVYTDETGSPQTLILNGMIDSPEAGKHYEIHIDVSQAEGYGTITLVADESYETEIVIINNEEPEMSGELLITEIMYNPSAISDTEGEYIEIQNVSEETVNLMDLVIRRGSNDDIHVIASDLPLLPGEIALLGRSASAAAEVDYIYSTISLLNTGDVLYINTYGTDGTDGSVICRVDYGAAAFPSSLNGISVQLDPSVTNVDQALLGTNWCASTSQFTTGDLGTPGGSNVVCE